MLNFPVEFDSCPAAIRAVIDMVAREPATKSIWFIGSRANSRARPESDWDIMVFTTEALSCVSARVPGLDILRVSPSGEVLLEGMPEQFTLEFSSFRWSRIDQNHAVYEGQRLRLTDSPRDHYEPPVEISKCRAFLVYER